MRQNSSRCRPFQSAAGAVLATIIAVLVALPGTTKAGSEQYSVIARVDVTSAGLTASDIVVRVEDASMPATGFQASPDVPRNVAIVIDAGPDQARVMSREKELAIALINELSDPSTSFTIASAGILSKLDATTPDRSAATQQVREVAVANGQQKNVFIYDAIGLAIGRLSLTPGLRIVIFIGEGNDGGSRLRYADLRSLAESNHIACLAALVADHSLRGAKGILRYGWNLQELTSDTAGIFLENQKTPTATRRLIESVRALRLVTFDMSAGQSGRYKISISSNRGRRLKAQKVIAIP
jgi:hypothetical protein